MQQKGARLLPPARRLLTLRGRQCRNDVNNHASLLNGITFFESSMMQKYRILFKLS